MISVVLRTLLSRITENTFWKEHCIYLPAMLGWFITSASLSSYNKIVFGEEHMNFPFPLLMTSVHFAVQWIFSYTISNVGQTSPSQPLSLRQSLGGNQIKSMSWATFLALSIPCGTVTASDVGLSNLALVRISLTFYTMVKASSPIFVVASAYLFGIERITPALIMVVLTICAGEALTVMGETQFDLVGFMLCLSAAVLSGLRWTVVQVVLSSIDPPLKSTIATMRLLSPVMFGSMFMFSMIIERPWIVLWGGDNGDIDGVVFDAHYALSTLGLAFGGAGLAIAMILCEFYLIMNSSAVVLMIGGVVKELTTIMAGVTFFGNNINAVNLMGCMVVFLGVLLYKLSLHIRKLEKECDAIENDENGSRTGDDCSISYERQSNESNTDSDTDEKNLFADGAYDEVEDSSQNPAIDEGTVQESSQSLLESDNRKIV